MDITCNEDLCIEVEKHQVEDVVFKFHLEMILWTIVHGILLVFIIGGNLLTIIAIRLCRRLRAVISNLFILSLAVSDLIVGLTLPYHLAFFLGLGLGRSEFLCLLRFYIIIFACCISMWSLISIAIDRYIAIVYPLHYRRFMTRRVAITIIALGWIVGTFVACIPVFWNKWDTADKCEFNDILPEWYICGIITPTFILVWICMLVVYWRIWQECAKQAKQLRAATCYMIKDSPSDCKSVQVVIFIMGSFTICWLPYFIVAVGQIYITFEICPTLYRAALALAIANSGLNPMIYAWKNSNFRKSFISLLHCRRPNCLYTSDYNIRQQYNRNGSQTQEAAEVYHTPELIREPSKTSIVTCDSQPDTNNNQQFCSPSALEPTDNFMLQLNAVQLNESREESQNILSIFHFLPYETKVPINTLCSPCEFCKFLMGRNIFLKGNPNGVLMPWKCSDYNHHIMNTIKCRW